MYNIFTIKGAHMKFFRPAAAEWKMRFALLPKLVAVDKDGKTTYIFLEFYEHRVIPGFLGWWTEEAREVGATDCHTTYHGSII